MQRLRWHERQLKRALDKKSMPAIFFPIKDTAVNYSRFTLRLLNNNFISTFCSTKIYVQDVWAVVSREYL